MGTEKIAVTIQAATLERLDRLVKEKAFTNRSQAVQAAIEEKLTRMDRSRLAAQCAKLDQREEKGLAEEGLAKAELTRG
jgi:Arc/MetJ-type ribon-helix-helix transcriptional regulator